jgi:Uma2 family endonuclease
MGSAKLTYDDYAAASAHVTPTEFLHVDQRYELLAGELYMVPSPSTFHQQVVKRLSRQLEAFFEGNRLGEVFFAPTDVVLGLHDVVEPDLLVADLAQISQRAIEGPPLLVIEVLSPSSRAYDRRLKAARYLALGVRHYWIVDPDRRQVVCQQAEGGGWVVVSEARDDGSVTDPAWPTLVIDLSRLWAPRRT